MKFDSADIGGKEVGSIRFQFEGDKGAAKSLVGEGRAILGALKNAMRFNDLWQHKTQVTYPDGTLIQASSIKGKGDLSDIDNIVIYVPSSGGGEPEYDEDMITGFIVTAERTSHLDQKLWMAVYGLEPKNELNRDAEKEPVLFDEYWTYSFGFNTSRDSSSYRWERDTLGDTTYNQWEWYGFEGDGFAKRPAGIGYELSLQEYTVSFDTPTLPLVGHGPRISMTPIGVDGVYHIGIGHYLWRPEDNGFYSFVGAGPTTNPSEYIKNYASNVDYINAIMVGQDQSDHRVISNGGLTTFFSTKNYLIGTLTNITQIDKKEFNFDQPPWYVNDSYQLDSDEPGYDPFFTYREWPYSSLCLLPKGSKITGSEIKPPYIPRGGGEGELISSTFASSYEAWFNSTLASNPAPYPIADSGGSPVMQYALFPSGYLAPYLTYVDYEIGGGSSESQAESEGIPDIKAIPGYYKVRILTAEYQYTPEWWDETYIEGVEYTLNITLFGSKYISKVKLSGESGKKNDKLSILVKTPIRFIKGDMADMLTKLIVLE